MSENTQTQTQPQGAEAQENAASESQAGTSTADKIELATKALVAGADTSEFSEEVVAAAEAKKTAIELEAKLAASEKQRKTFQEKAESVDPYTLLSDDQKTELDSLRETDFEQYYKKRQEFENEARQKFTQTEQEDNTKSQLEAAISLHNARNPNMPVSLETLEQDIPLRLRNDLTEKMNAGTITPADAINTVSEYLSGSKVIGKPTQPTDIPNLSDAPGASTLPEVEKKVGDPNDYQVF